MSNFKRREVKPEEFKGQEQYIKVTLHNTGDKHWDTPGAMQVECNNLTLRQMFLASMVLFENVCKQFNEDEKDGQGITKFLIRAFDKGERAEKLVEAFIESKKDHKD